MTTNPGDYVDAGAPDKYSDQRFGFLPPMELRDWFAGMALSGMLGDHTRDASWAEHAQIAYRYADAMLAERNK